MSTAAISLPRLARHNPLAAIGILFVVGFIFCALFAPWIAPQDPAHIDLPNRLQTPSSQHIEAARREPRGRLPADLGSSYFDVRRQ